MTTTYVEITPFTNGDHLVSTIYESPDALHRGCQCCSLQPNMDAAMKRAREDSEDIRINPTEEPLR